MAFHLRRTRWLALLAVGLMLILTACGAKAEPLPAPAPGPGGSQPAPNPEPEPQPEPITACSSIAPTAAAGEKLVTVYFACGDPEAYPTIPVAVQRAVPADEAELTAALTALLAGPTEAELAAGFRSWFSAQTAGFLNGVEVDDGGLAIVDLKTFSHIIPNASTSAGSELLLAELGWTVAQFPEVETIEYRFDGSCNLIGEWLQSGCVQYPVDPYR